MNDRPRPVLVLLLLLLAGFAPGGCEAPGHAERVGPAYLRAAQPIEAVRLHFQPFNDPHTVIARLRAEASVARFGSREEAETAAWDTLRRLAAKQGATEVVNIEQRMVEDDAGATVVEMTAEAAIRRAGVVDEPVEPDES